MAGNSPKWLWVSEPFSHLSTMRFSSVGDKVLEGGEARQSPLQAQLHQQQRRGEAKRSSSLSQINRLNVPPPSTVQTKTDIYPLPVAFNRVGFPTLSATEGMVGGRENILRRSTDLSLLNLLIRCSHTHGALGWCQAS